MKKVFFKRISLVGLFLFVIFSSGLFEYKKLTIGKDYLVYAGDASAVEQLDFANGLFERGIYEMAVNEYKKFIELFPKSEFIDEAYFGIAESKFFSESYKEAIEGYKRYLELFPDGEKVDISNLRIGESSFLTEGYEQALNYFAQVKSENLDKNFLQALYFYIAKTYRAKGDKAKALEYLEKTQAVSEGSGYTVYAFIEVGDIFLEDAKYEKAIEYYNKAQRIADSDEIKGLALYKEAETQFSAGDYAASADTFKRVLEGYQTEELSRDSFANLLLSLFNITRYEDLIREYTGHKKLISDDEKFFTAHYIAACAYSELGQHDESISILDKVLSSVSLGVENRQKALLKRTEILLKARRFNDAMDFIEKELVILQQAPDQIIFLKAEAYYGMGNFEKSYELYKKIVDEFPASPLSGDALYGMAYSKNSLGKGEEALQLFLEYFKKEKDSAKRQQALYSAILLETKLGMREEAIKHGETYLVVFKDGRLTEKVLFRLGSLYSETKRYSRAIDTFRLIAQQFGNSERLQEAYFLLAYNLQLSGNSDEALEYYQKISPGKTGSTLFYSALKNTALIYLNLEREEDAAKVLDRIITDFDTNDLDVDTYLWLARHHLNKKNFNDVLRVIKKAESKQNSKDKKEEMAYFKAEAFREISDFQKALENYDIVLKSKEQDMYLAASRIGRGLCLVELSKLDKAKSEFETAIQEYPNDNTVTMRARFELANIQRLTNNLQDAGKLYMLVAILYSDEYYCPEALFRAGEIFETLNKKREAVKAYAEIVERYQKSHLYEKAKKRIEALNEN